MLSMIRPAALLLLALIAQLATAQALVVTTTVDEDDFPQRGEVSLREALREAASGDTITFAPSLSGTTLNLTRGSLVAGRPVTIDASALAAPVAISSDGSSRVMEVAPLATLTLRNLTIENGSQPTSRQSSIGGYDHLLEKY